MPRRDGRLNCCKWPQPDSNRVLLPWKGSVVATWLWGHTQVFFLRLSYCLLKSKGLFRKYIPAATYSNCFQKALLFFLSPPAGSQISSCATLQIGMTGLEPTISWSQIRRVTKLRYIPLKAEGGTRTHNPLITNQLRCQLCHSSINTTCNGYTQSISWISRFPNKDARWSNLRVGWPTDPLLSRVGSWQVPVHTGGPTTGTIAINLYLNL